VSRPALLLVVDDDPDLRLVVTSVLERQGYRVLSAENGAAALDLLARADELPHLILLDMMMPVMNGWAFCAARDQDPNLARIPVVLFSAHAEIDAETEALHAVASLQKPLRAPQLVEAVAKYVR
jgi:CheY-like chemotaxis protein